LPICHHKACVIRDDSIVASLKWKNI